ncbi:hypothetical protein Bca4012_013549 [Brassica carinata]
MFVDLSHSPVTIPTPCWTNTAHRHGVKVLGTFITEWDEGKATCNEMLATKESAQMCAERLAELSTSLGFDGWMDGWLVKSDETSKLGLLLLFLSPSHETKSILVAPQEPIPRLDHMFMKCLVTSEQTVSEWTVLETSLVMDWMATH